MSERPLSSPVVCKEESRPSGSDHSIRNQISSGRRESGHRSKGRTKYRTLDFAAELKHKSSFSSAPK